MLDKSLKKIDISRQKKKKGQQQQQKKTVVTTFQADDRAEI